MKNFSPEPSKNPSVDNQKLLASKSHHFVIKDLTDKIFSAVNTLYEDEESGNEGEGQEKKKRNKEDSDEEEDNFFRTDNDSGTYDLKHSKEHVKNLMDNLKLTQRSQLIAELNDWFANKSKLITNDMEVLNTLENECGENIEKMEKIHEEIYKNIDEKELKNFEVLHEFYSMLHKISNQKKWKNNANGEKSDKNILDDIKQTDLYLQDLKNDLLTKESEISQILNTIEPSFSQNKEAQSTQQQTSDLLHVINVQKDEIETLSAKLEGSESRLKNLKLALSFLESGADEKSPAVTEDVRNLIIEIKNKVREQRVNELLATRNQEDDGLNVPDEEEILRLEQECQNMKQQIQTLEVQVKKYKEPTEREIELTNRLASLKELGIQFQKNDAELSLTDTKRVITLLENELTKIQQENDILQSQIQSYDTLIADGESSLQLMQQQKNIFLQAVEKAKKSLFVDAIRSAESEERAAMLLQQAQIETEGRKHLLESLDNFSSDLTKRLVNEESELQEEIKKMENEFGELQEKIKKDAISKMSFVQKLLPNGASSATQASNSALSSGPGTSLEEKETEKKNELLAIQYDNQVLLKEIESLTQLLLDNTIEEREEKGGKMEEQVEEREEEIPVGEKQRENGEKERKEDERSRKSSLIVVPEGRAASAISPRSLRVSMVSEAKGEARKGEETKVESEKEKKREETSERKLSLGRSFQSERVSEVIEKRLEGEGQSKDGTRISVSPPPPSASKKKKKAGLNNYDSLEVASLSFQNVIQRLSDLKGNPSWKCEDMDALVKIQEENYVLAQQIQSIEKKMTILNSTKEPITIEFLHKLLEDTSTTMPSNDGNVSSNSQHNMLHQEIKKKQKELYALRKQWWDAKHTYSS